MADLMKSSRLKLFAAISLFVYCLLVQSIFAQEFGSEKQSAPIISDIVPREVTQGTFIKIAGYKLGGIDKNQVFFLQGGSSFAVNAAGASWSGDDYINGLNYQIVKVPEEVIVGNCQVIVEFEGRRSLPLMIEVLPLAKPPKLISLVPLIANADESIWITGIGFNDKDTIEVTDSEGRKFTHLPQNTSNVGSILFPIPNKMSSGLAVLKVIENRSGLNQPSNNLTFEVKRGAVPLTLDDEDLVSVSPGQWIEPILWSNSPLVNATKIEFLLRQANQEQMSFVSDFKKIRFQIPAFFTAGKIEIQTRTWIKDEVSVWSQPIGYEVAEKPRSPIIESIEIVPAKAEAMFKQNEKAIAILPLYLGVLPRSAFPEKIKNGKLEILTRFLDKGKFTDWKSVSKYDDFKIETYADHNFHPEYDKAKSFTFNPFFERFYIGGNSTDFFEISRGQYLRINGDFFVGSIDELQVTLEKTGQKIYLKPMLQEFESMILVKMPNNLLTGDWTFSVTNRSKQLVTTAQVKLRVN